MTQKTKMKTNSYSILYIPIAPTAPQKLKAIDIKSNSIDLQWNKPAEINGPSITYQLWYNERMIHIDNNETANYTFHYRLNDLESFTNYTITVVACTRNCSPSSGSVIQRTRVGKPGQIYNIYINERKNDSLKLIWDKPNDFRGYYKYYLLSVSKSNGYDTKKFLYKISSNRTSCIIQELGCDNNNYLYFYIRGVNVDNTKSEMHYATIIDSENCLTNIGDDNEEGQFYGDLSFRLSHTCPKTSSILLLMLDSPVFLLIAVVLLTILVFTSGIKLYKAFKKLQGMKDIQILWPDGLDPNATSKGESICALDDFDLLKTCKNLEKIREESLKELEFYENDFTSKEIQEKLFDENNKELLAPLFTKSQTLDVIRDGSIVKTKSLSVPTSPLKYDPNIDSRTGYVKMHQPQKSPTNVSVGGYLDMTGKSSNPYINQSHMLNSNDIKTFIQDSQMNNGYIQRNSIKNSVPIKNSSGYVGFASFNKK